VGSASFTLLGLPNGLPACRIGLTVSRKIGSAVRRNRVKRMLREVFRYNRRTLEPPLDLVVLARPGIHERTVAELEAEFAGRFVELARKWSR
jgi:ribonuclease P protein component